MTAAKDKYSLVVINQSIDPAYVEVFSGITPAKKKCLLITGSDLEIKWDNIDILQGPEYRRDDLRSRIGSWLKFTLYVLRKLPSIPGRPFIYATTNPPLMPWIAWLMKKIKGNKFGLLFFDIYPEVPVQLGWIRREGIIAKVIRFLNRKAMLAAEIVVTLGEGMKSILQNQNGVADSRVNHKVIPYVVDGEFLKPRAKSQNPFALKHKISDKTIVLYSGNLGKTHNTGFILDLAEKFKDNDEALFLIIGDGFGRSEIEARLRKSPLPNVRLLHFQPREMMPYSLAAGDIALIVQAPGAEDFSLPSKLYSSLAVGSAVFALTKPSSDLAEIVNKLKVGSTAEDNDLAGSVRILGSLLNDKTALAEMKQTARKAAEDHFSVQAIIELYRESVLPFM